ncbi:hypothetical protein [Plesiomonas shigelloides]|uniref:hypothetical protein n=1 Tax=Plesiomonas shigelloides TaxID=703 RepID=UPI0012614F21|nr:hypothetical protein [Plesiomonas shigelloides]KAB7664972.1 hypothetical protein GBN25_07630 [Plesiomonas shigelloides]
MAEIKKDEQGFYYFEHVLEAQGYRVVLFRSEDICNILEISPVDTALEHHYIDLHDAVLLSMTNSKEEFAMYLNEKFVGDHMHPHTIGAPLPRIISTELDQTDRLWSDLIVV